jgi:hypothetical protein
MKERPPFLAKAMAMLWSETDCMMAETKGTLSVISDSCPFLNFTSGVFKLIRSGTQLFVVSPGINRYSLNVLEMSFKYCAINPPSFKNLAKILIIPHMYSGLEWKRATEGVKPSLGKRCPALDFRRVSISKKNIPAYATS